MRTMAASTYLSERNFGKAKRKHTTHNTQKIYYFFSYMYNVCTLNACYIYVFTYIYSNYLSKLKHLHLNLPWMLMCTQNTFLPCHAILYETIYFSNKMYERSWLLLCRYILIFLTISHSLSLSLPTHTHIYFCLSIVSSSARLCCCLNDKGFLYMQNSFHVSFNERVLFFLVFCFKIPETKRQCQYINKEPIVYINTHTHILTVLSISTLATCFFHGMASFFLSLFLFHLNYFLQFTNPEYEKTSVLPKISSKK